MDELRKMDSVFGATGRDDIRYISADVLRKVIGANIKIVPGYPGKSDTPAGARKVGNRRRMRILAKPSRPPSRIDQRQEDQHRRPVRLPKGSGIAQRPVDGDYAAITDGAGGAAADLSPSESGPAIRRAARRPRRSSSDALRRAFDATMKDPEFLSHHREAEPRPRSVARAKRWKSSCAAPYASRLPSSRRRASSRRLTERETA